jgi:hypothetical protein
VLPIIAAVIGNCPAMLVKLNGLTARTNPSVVEVVVLAALGDVWLPVVDLGGVVGVEPDEVGELADAVDLGLVVGLGLVEHRRCVDLGAILAGDQLGRAQEDADPLPPRHPRPRVSGLECFLDGAVDVGLVSQAQVAEDDGVLVRADHSLGPLCVDQLATNLQRDVLGERTQPLDLGRQRLSLW